jgi:hypothetical protein
MLFLSHTVCSFDEGNVAELLLGDVSSQFQLSALKSSLGSAQEDKRQMNFAMYAQNDISFHLEAPIR